MSALPFASSLVLTKFAIGRVFETAMTIASPSVIASIARKISTTLQKPQRA